MRHFLLGVTLLLILPLASRAAAVDSATGMADLGGTLISEEFADGTTLGPGVTDPDGIFAYIASLSSGRIFKIRIRSDAGAPMTPAVEATVDVSGASNFSAAFMDPVGRYAYFATETTPARVVRLATADLSITTLALDYGDAPVRTGVIDADGSHLFLGTGTAPGRVIKIENVNFTVAASMTLQSGEDDLRAAAYDGAGGHLYFATVRTPGRIVQIRIVDFTRIASIEFAQNEGPAHALVFTNTSAPKILAGIFGAPGRVLQFTTAPFAQYIAGTMALPDPEFLVGEGLYVSARRAAYFLTDTAPVVLIKFDASGPLRLGSVSLSAREGIKPHAFADPQGEFLYTSTGPDVFRRIALTAEAASAAETAAAPPSPPPSAEGEADAAAPELLPTGFSAGDLVKLPDDGNTETFGDAAIYYLSRNGQRYVFPNDKVYFSWYDNFSSVKFIDAVPLSSIQLGGVVLYRPGTRMVKLETSPTVYVVGPSGLLRAIPDEEMAAALYGTDWNQQIDDIPDAFWARYRLGDPLSGSVDFNVTAELAAAPTIDYDK